MRDNRVVVPLLKKLLHSDFNCGLNLHMFSEFRVVPALCQNLVFCVIFVCQCLDVGSGNRIDIRRQIIDIIMVNLPSEFNLRLNLVAFRNGNIVHVVAKSAHSDM